MRRDRRRIHSSVSCVTNQGSVLHAESLAPKKHNSDEHFDPFFSFVAVEDKLRNQIKRKERNQMNPPNHFKKIRILPLAITLALAAFAAPKIARADAVTDWNAIASTAIVATAGQSPHAAPLSFAMVHGAVYDAVNAIDRGYQPYLAQPPSNPTDSKEAATAAAAFRVLVGFLDLPGL